MPSKPPFDPSKPFKAERSGPEISQGKYVPLSQRNYADSIFASKDKGVESDFGLDDLLTSITPMGAGKAMLAVAPLIGKIKTKGAKLAGEVLSMSKAARMARAEKMGFDPAKTFYHGTAADISEFKVGKGGAAKFGEGIYFTPNPSLASGYAQQTKGGNVIPAFLKNDNPVNLADQESVDAAYDAMGITKLDLPPKLRKKYDDEFNNFNQMIHSLQQSGDFNAKEVKSALTKKLQAAGYTGIFVPEEQISIVFDPSQVRSVNAVFDPKKEKSGNLLAGGAGAAALYGALQGESAAATEKPKFDPNKPFKPVSVQKIQNRKVGGK